MKSQKQTSYDNGESAVAAVLKAWDRQVKLMGYYDPYDLWVDNAHKIEVKCASPRFSLEEKYFWSFNIHRHGKLVENCDWYIFRFEDVPGSKKAVHILLKAPLGRKVMSYHLRAMIRTLAPDVERFEHFCRTGEFI